MIIKAVSSIGVSQILIIQANPYYLFFKLSSKKDGAKSLFFLSIQQVHPLIYFRKCRSHLLFPHDPINLLYEHTGYDDCFLSSSFECGFIKKRAIGLIQRKF